MSLLVKIDTHPTFEPKVAHPTAEKLISGDPVYKTWAQDSSRDDKIRTGIWESTPGSNHSIKGTMLEFCYLVSGLVEIEEKGGATHTFKAGDSFVMKPGFVGVWRTIETVRKIYVCVYE